MANTFNRFPIVHADENQWGPLQLMINRDGVGFNNCKLYDDAGTLKISIGRIGIYDGTNEGISNIDTVTTINLAAVTNGNWAKVEMSVSGTSVTFAASDTNTGVDTDWSVIPTTLSGAYSYTKSGYYITAAKRTIGIVWVDSSGNLEGIINCGNDESYNGYCYYDSDEDLKLMWNSKKDSYRNWGVFEIGDWDMDADIDKAVTHQLDGGKIRSIDVMIQSDVGQIFKFESFNAGAGLANGFILDSTCDGSISLRRRGGGLFDSVSFDATSYNRGWIYVELAES